MINNDKNRRIVVPVTLADHTNCKIWAIKYKKSMAQLVITALRHYIACKPPKE